MTMRTEKQREGEGPLDNLDQRPDPTMSREELTEELGELRALTAGLLSTVPMAFIVLDRKWRLAYLNDKARELFDASGEQPNIGDYLADIYPRKLGRILSPEMIKEILESKTKVIQKYTHFLHRWYKISAQSADYGIFIRLEDNTSDMIVNRLLRLNEFSVKQAVDMIFWFMPGGHIIYANKAACESLGYTSGELTKLKVADIGSSYLAENWAEFVKDIKNKISMTFEISLRAKKGRIIPAEVTANFLDYHGDEYIMVFARDITERQKADRSLKEMKAEAELYVDLMSHDINNMNQVAMGYLELAIDMIKENGRIDEEHMDMVSKPYEMLLNSTKLIENVKKIRLERLGHYKPRVMNIYDILEDVKNNYPSVAGRDVRIELTRRDDCQVSANELLKDIFMNLVGNAVKHSSGPILISINMAKVTEDGAQYCRVSVEDNGPGITDENKNKIFNRLTSDNIWARGKGFGLYLIKQLVDDFGGRFWVEDRVPGDYKKGAKFVVLLPVARNDGPI